MIEWRGIDAVLQYTITWFGVFFFWWAISKRSLNCILWLKWYLFGLLLLLVILELKGTR